MAMQPLFFKNTNVLFPFLDLGHYWTRFGVQCPVVMMALPPKCKQGLAACTDWDVFSLANPRDRDGPGAGKKKLLETLETELGDDCGELFPALASTSIEAVQSHISAGLDHEALAGIDVPALLAWLQVTAHNLAPTSSHPSACYSSRACEAVVPTLNGVAVCPC